MVSLCLKADEIHFLIKKWESSGLSKYDACKRLDKLRIELHNLVIKLKDKGKDEDYINKEFRKKFEIECRLAEI